MTKCILTGDPLTLENDSDAHIIPNALGGSLKPRGLLTSVANTFLNERLDAPLIRALAPLMSLVDGRRDRGENQALVMHTADGTKYRVPPRGPMSLDAPSYQETVISDSSTIIEIRTRTMKEAKQLLQRAQSSFPWINVEAAMAYAEDTSTYLHEPLRARFELGPNRVFPGVFGIANLYAAHLKQQIHREFVGYTNGVPVRRGPLSDGKPELSPDMPPDTFYWMPAVPPYSRAEGIDHVLAYVGNPKTGQALVVMSFFGLPPIAVRLPFDGGEILVAHYAVDLLTGQSKAVDVDLDHFVSEPWTSTHVLGDPLLYAATTVAVDRILAHAHNQSMNRELGRIVNEEVAKAHTAKEAISRIAERIAQISAAQEAMSGRSPLAEFGRVADEPSNEPNEPS